MLLDYCHHMSKDNRLEDWIDQVIGDIGHDFWDVWAPRSQQASSAPTRYTSEIVNGELFLSVDVPGVALSDIDVSIDKNLVIVKTKRGKRSATHKYTISEAFITKPESAKLSLGVLELKFLPAKLKSTASKVEVVEVK